MIRIVRNIVFFLAAAVCSAGRANIIAAPSARGADAGARPWPGGHEHVHGDEAPRMSDAKVAAAGIELEKAGPGVLRDTLRLNGMLQPNQEALVQVTPRFPGVVREVHKRVGDRVQKDEVLAQASRATRA